MKTFLVFATKLVREVRQSPFDFYEAELLLVIFFQFFFFR